MYELFLQSLGNVMSFSELEFQMMSHAISLIGGRELAWEPRLEPRASGPRLVTWGGVPSSTPMRGPRTTRKCCSPS